MRARTLYGKCGRWRVQENRVEGILRYTFECQGAWLIEAKFACYAWEIRDRGREYKFKRGENARLNKDVCMRAKILSV